MSSLMKADILREFKYQTWVANPVMVKKSDGRWKMCVDFTYTTINKSCPKDCYPLPEINQKVESLSGVRLKCLLDAYKGYHKIQMAEGDEDKIAFFTGKGVFCYLKMPFGLKNAGAIYQRLVDKVFNDQIGKNLEAYVDDMVIKSTSEESMLKDIQETFDKLQAINMKLNPKSVPLASRKVKAISDLKPPRTLKEIQSLNGKLAALSRFLSNGVDKSIPFIKVLKSCMDKKTIQWTADVEEAFQKMKEFIEILPTLTAPIKGQSLVMYLAASTEGVTPLNLSCSGILNIRGHYFIDQ
ncbi:reverse transcriptase domain-containing protein [Tanacetum coccineum]